MLQEKDQVTYCHIKRNGLYIVAASKSPLSLIFMVEFLTRFFHICKDFCGMVNEDAIRANILLIYEILDEILEFGYVQLSTTEKIKPYIQCEPVVVLSNRSPAEEIASRLFGIENRSAPSSAASKPVVGAVSNSENRRNEIFVDVIERMTAVVNSSGLVGRMDVIGSVNVRSFLTGNPVIQVALNENLTLGEDGSLRDYNNHVNLEQCNFHQCVKLENFDESKCLVIHPPVGEFSALTYRLAADPPLCLPFRLLVFFQETHNSRDTSTVFQLNSDLPINTQAVNITVRIPVPAIVIGNYAVIFFEDCQPPYGNGPAWCHWEPQSATAIFSYSSHTSRVSKLLSKVINGLKVLDPFGLSQQLSGPDQSVAFKSSDKQIIWKIKKLQGLHETKANLRLVTQNGGKIKKKDIGPIAMEFEASGFACSGLQIRFLRVFDRDQAYVPYRWIRYITISDSYIFKM